MSPYISLSAVYYAILTTRLSQGDPYNNVELVLVRTYHIYMHQHIVSSIGREQQERIPGAGQGLRQRRHAADICNVEVGEESDC
jgi:hypothetical protein